MSVCMSVCRCATCLRYSLNGVVCEWGVFLQEESFRLRALCMTLLLLFYFVQDVHAFQQTGFLERKEKVNVVYKNIQDILL